MKAGHRYFSDGVDDVERASRMFYVYVMFRPDGSPCYVGKGQGDRWATHNQGRTHNNDLAAIIEEYGELPVVKVRENLTDEEARSVEGALIAAIGRVGRGGTLVNIMSGEPLKDRVYYVEDRPGIRVVITVPPELHMQIKISSIQNRITMNEFGILAFEDFMERIGSKQSCVS